jgi:hypothetical protein
MKNYKQLLLCILLTTACAYAHSANSIFSDGIYALAESFIEDEQITTTLAFVRLKNNGKNFTLTPADDNTSIHAQGRFLTGGIVSIKYVVNEQHTIEYKSTTADHNYAYGTTKEHLNGELLSGSWEFKKVPAQ